MSSPGPFPPERTAFAEGFSVAIVDVPQVVNASAQVQALKKEQDAKANEVYANAFGRDPEFAKFYRSLDAYRSSFSKPTDMMVVDPSSEFFDYLKNSKGEKN